MSNQKIDIKSLKIAGISEENQIFLITERNNDAQVSLKHPITNLKCNFDIKEPTICRTTHGLLNLEFLAVSSLSVITVMHLYHLAIRDNDAPNYIQHFYSKDFIKEVFVTVCTAALNYANYHFFQSTDYLPTLEEVLALTTEEQKCEMLNHLAHLSRENHTLKSIIIRKYDDFNCNHLKLNNYQLITMSTNKLHIKSLRIANIDEENQIFLKSEFTNSEGEAGFKHPLTNQYCQNHLTNHSVCNLNLGLVDYKLASFSYFMAIAGYNLYQIYSVDTHLTTGVYNQELAKRAFDTIFKVLPVASIPLLANMFLKSTDYLPTLDEVLAATPEEEKCETLNHLSVMAGNNKFLNEVIAGHSASLDCQDAYI